MLEIISNDIFDRSVTCEKILATKHAPICQQLLKKGLTPTPLRGQLWSIVMNSEIVSEIVKHILIYKRKFFDQNSNFSTMNIGKI
jgi:hypothetical protein